MPARNASPSPRNRPKAGQSVTWLETNDQLEAALALYRQHGFVEVEPFDDEPFATHRFRKELQATKQGALS